MTTSDRERREALARFYAARHRILALAVRRRAEGLDEALVADACADAWLKLVRRPDINLNQGGFMWLLLIATREARRLDRGGREQPAGTLAGGPVDADELAEPAGVAEDPLIRVLEHEAHQERVQRFAALKPRERRELLLHAGGYRYHEIAALTGSTYTAVNRRISEGRARLRRAQP